MYQQIGSDYSTSSNTFDHFIDDFTNIFQISFPLTKHNGNHSDKHFKQPWMTPSLLKCCRKKSRLQKNFAKFPTVVNKVKYNT